MIEKGDHQVEDPLESRQYFARGCDLKDGPSCTSATATCVKEGPLQDFALAFNYATKGMLVKSTICSTSKSYRFRFSLLVKFQMLHKSSSLIFFIEGCDVGDHRSCGNLSLMYMRGEGVEKNEELGQQIRDKAQSILANFQQERPNVTFGR